MSFALPSLSDLWSQVAAGFAARLAGADSTLRFGVIPTATKVIANGIYSGFRALGWLSRQLFISSAEAPYLDRRLADYGMSREPATLAAGNAIFSGQPGIPVPSATLLNSSDGAQGYTTQAAGTVYAISASASTTTSGSNTGNGTIGALIVFAAAVTGTYRVNMTSSTAFNVLSPSSTLIGTGTVGTAFTSGQIGLTVTAGGTPFAVNDGFSVVVAGTGANGSVTVPVLARVAGSAGNQNAGAPLTIAAAIAGVNPTANADSAGLTGGTDIESDASFRARGLARIQAPPQGGAGTDFWQWARNSGVPTRAWVYPLGSGIGTCQVGFVIDTRSNNIPLSGDIATVQAYIDEVAPVIGEYTVFAPTPQALSITIHGMLPGDAATQAAVVEQLNALVATVPPGGATYGDGVTIPLQSTALFPKQVPGKLYLSMIEAAIDAVGTIQSYDLTLPSSDVTFATGVIPAAPSVTFT